MTIPDISIIIPVFNGGSYLKPCLDSIAGQTHRAIEVILVDDGSTDDSGAICDEYAKADPRFKVIHQKNQGPSAARNAGLAEATGEWLSFVDCDDRAEPDLCAYLLGLARTYEADMVQCGFFLETGSTTRALFVQKEEISIPEGLAGFRAETWRLLCNGNCGKLFRRDKLVGIRFDPAYRIGEDCQFNLRALTRVEGVVFGAEAKYHYNQTENSLFRSPPSRETLLSFRKMLEQTRQEFPRHEALQAHIPNEHLRNDLDICSRIVCFRPDGAEDILSEVRSEIRRGLAASWKSPAFSRAEKLKFLLIAHFWPVYCVLLKASKVRKNS